ncbi:MULTISPECIES: restriction endonuclease subunit S [Serratia]|uniref:restriction endonuclease subunit S n=1 Tax=Serratia TaxID=613 RepID=UPI0018D3D0A0|nr:MULTISPECIES: restriction endonuclease subunit S [Serratia]MBH1925764.1 restriction endonuclease subunit S [Serratia ureilytica]MBH2541442.1 restriction endonuclease subunit S [Serratia ureilytica]MBH2649231.1 restriction endonuclease subunit S [Serratia ureilytica]CAF2660771.1 hypothetical protein AI2887V1_0461 [Serratia marcescens]CAH5053354.1 hypothetical protein AI2887V1_0461 [Serratia marcescens]
MAKYKAYPEYKDSGVEWLGEVPSHWEILSAKRMFQSVRTPAYKSDEQLAASQKYGVIPQSLMMQLNDSKVMLALKGTESFRHVETNNFVISLRSFEGGIEYSQYTGCVSPAYTVLKNSKPISYGYYRYLLKCTPFIAALQSSTDSLRDGKSINYEQFSALSLPLPLVREQNVIAAFLDHETAKIDNLIEKQQQLIELLKEKSQAVISHAVTKGLNPDVPMKDSGVEWLGEVPEHWRVSRVKNFAKIESGHTPSKTKSEYWVNCIIPWVSLNDSKQLKNVDYIEDTTYKISELGMANSSAHLLPARAVVFTRDASIGLSAITTKPMAVSQHLIAWLCNERFVVPEFLLLVFYAMEKEFERYTFGATIKTIGMDNVRGLRSAFPPIDEQHKLIEWAFKKLEKIKFSINKVEDIISLLQERRTALISAAVTGKIDVRDWVAPDMQDAEEPQETTA